MTTRSLLSFCRGYWRCFTLLPAIAVAQTDPSPPAPVPTPFAVEPAAQVVIGSGFDYSRGDYGFASDTEVFAVPLNVSYETDTWILRVSQSWLRVRGPATVVLAGAGVGSGVGGAVGRPVSSAQSGSGDLNVGATFRFNPPSEQLNVAFTGRVKFGTANENKGLGSGQTDYYAQLDFTRPYGATVPFVSVGYRFLGRSALYPLRDGAYLSGGVIRRLSGTTQVGLALDWRERVVVGGDNGCELTGS